MTMSDRRDGPNLDPTSRQSAARSVATTTGVTGAAGSAAPAPENTETRQVLVQRVIALSGVPEGPKLTPKPTPTGIDLSRRVHEWGLRQNAPITTKLQQPADNVPVDAQWATHSSISLEFCSDAQLPQDILNANIEDAVTLQYSPAATKTTVEFGTTTTDLVSLDRAWQSAGVPEAQELSAITNLREPSAPELTAAEAPPPTQPAPIQPAPIQPPPRMMLVPAAIVWAVLTVFSLCALTLTLLIVTYLFRDHLSH
jgi:hypothetical protein